MQISSINLYTNINFKNNRVNNTNKNKKAPSIPLQNLQKPAEISIQKRNEETFFQNFLTKKGKVTSREYTEIIKKHPSVIVKAQKLIEDKKTTKSNPKDIAIAAVKLKEKYDNEYNGNYTIVSVGTSPAPITEVMSALGCNVIFIPASGLNSIETNKHYIFRNQYPTVASRIQNINHIIEYAKKKGINENSKEYLILLDYCHTGTGLDNLHNIFIEENVFNPEKLYDHSILNDLSDVSNFRDSNSIFRLENLANISHDMQFSSFEAICNVPHFYVYDDYNKTHSGSISSENKKRRELFKEFDDYSQSLARAYSLCAIHEAMKIM